MIPDDGPSVEDGGPPGLLTLDGSPVRPLGLGGRAGQETGCLDVALDGGVNLVFSYHPRQSLVAPLARRLQESRRSVFVAAGSDARSPGGLGQALEETRRRLSIRVVDLFVAEYVCPADDPSLIFGPGGVLDELAARRRQGEIRHAGASVHDRELAVRLATDPRVDVLMHRYNMAHRGAEEAVFPATLVRGMPVIAFTATRWGSLLGSRDGSAPSAVDCYRFCLAHPAVAVVLASPMSAAEARADLAVLAAPPPGAGEMAGWRRHGEVVYGGGDDPFETEWP